MRSPSAILAVTLGLLLAGCGTMTKTPHLNPPGPAPAAPVAPTPAIVKPPPPTPPTPMPVKRSCVPRAFPRAPAYPDTDAALRVAGGAADRYQLLAAGRVLRALRLAELERAIDACR